MEVTYDEVAVPKSPFRVGVAEGCDPSRVRAHGPGLEGGLVGKANRFTVETRWASDPPATSHPCHQPTTSSPSHGSVTSVLFHWMCQLHPRPWMCHLCPMPPIWHHLPLRWMCHLHLLALDVAPPSPAMDVAPPSLATNVASPPPAMEVEPPSVCCHHGTDALLL